MIDKLSYQTPTQASLEYKIEALVSMPGAYLAVVFESCEAGLPGTSIQYVYFFWFPSK